MRLFKYIGYIFLCFLFCHSQNCVAQDMIKSARSAKKKLPVKVKPVKSSVLTRGILIITTNLACNFQVNNKHYGVLGENATQKIVLPIGIHNIQAKSVNTSYEFNAEITVTGGNTALLLDFNRVIALAKSRQDSLSQLSKKADPVVVANRNADTQARAVNRPILVNNPVVEKTAGAASSIWKLIANTLVSDLIKIPANIFSMGNNLGDNDEGPEHAVKIRPVQFCKYEITQEQWQKVMNSNPSRNKDCDNCPVENITWEEAQVFISRLNQASGKKFRLPTEAEWEYVASKAKDKRLMTEKAWYKVNAEKFTHPVGSLAPNSLGIYDMAGNVAEWCSDWYGLSYYKTKVDINPTGPEDGKYKVVRGGAYEDSEKNLRLTLRDKQSPQVAKATTGLRLVLDGDP